MKKPIIAFCGMTHLGLNSAAASAQKGFETYCFDLDQQLISNLEEGQIPITEPQLNDFLRENSNRLCYTSHAETLSSCDVVFISSDVPTDNHGQSDLAGIRALLACIVPHIRKDATLVILSQVPPGFTRSISHPLLSVYYQVETLIFGQAIERAMCPERFIIGADKPDLPLHKGYEAYLQAFHCPLITMRYESAELAKISINMCLVASIGVANTMAEICEKIGANWHEIIPALKLDKRIGQYAYIAPGLGIAGGNLERDLATVIQLAQKHNADCEIVKAWIKNSEHRKNWVYRALQQCSMHNIKKIALLGLAYKENTHSIKNAPSVTFLSNIEEQIVHAFDPAVKAADIPFDVEQAESALDAVKDADATIIMTPWPEFRELPVHLIAEYMKGDILIDPFSILSAKQAEQCGLKYMTLGVSKELTENA